MPILWNPTSSSAPKKLSLLKLLAGPGTEIIAACGSVACNGVGAARNTFLIDPRGVLRKNVRQLVGLPVSTAEFGAQALALGQNARYSALAVATVSANVSPEECREMALHAANLL